MKKDTRDRLLLPIVVPFGALALIGLALFVLACCWPSRTTRRPLPR